MPPKKVIKLSATRINSYLQCKQRYWFNYIDKIDKLPNPVFALGLTCHETLEEAARIWMKEELTSFSKDQIKSLLIYYDKMSVDQGIQDHEDHILGKQLVKSRLNNFKIGNKIIGIEDKFGFPKSQKITTKDGIELIGALDKTVEYDEDTLLIVDYKTSKTVPDVNKLRSDIQLSMYNLVAKQLYPGYKRIILSLDMLRKGEIVYTYRTDEELDDFEAYLTVIHKEMSSITKKKAVPTLNFLCGWCDYCNICDKYKDACTKKEFDFLAPDHMSDKDMMQEWEDVRSTKKILEMREKTLADVMMEKIKIHEKDVTDGEKEMVLRQMARVTYKPTSIAKLISYDDFVSIASLSPKKLKEYLDKNPAVKQVVEEESETNYTKAFLASKKVKKSNKKKK